MDQRTNLSNELRSTLKTCFPQALHLCGDDLWTALALDFLTRWPELAALQKAKPATVRSFYTTRNSRRPAVIAERLELIAQAHALTTDRAVLAPAILQIQLLVAVLRPLQAQSRSTRSKSSWGHNPIKTTAGYRHPVVTAATNPLDDLLK